MPRRTTLVLDDRVYEKLVEESMKRYGNARKLSQVVNDLVEQKAEAKPDLMRLIYSKKIASTTARDFQRFRRKLAARLED